LTNIAATTHGPANPGLNTLQTWGLALLPSADNYTLIAMDPRVSLGRAYLWLGVTTLIGGIISTLVSVGVDLVLGPSKNPVLASLGAGSPTLQGTLNGLLFGVPIQTIVTLVGITLAIGLCQFVSHALGGRGSFTQLFYAFAAFFAPLTLINSLIGSLPLVGVLVVLIALYGLVLNFIAVKTVHQFSGFRAFLAGVVVPVVLGLLVAVVVLIVVAASGLGQV
jgi:hypothetical protein